MTTTLSKNGGPINRASKTLAPDPQLDAVGITALAKSQKPDKQRDLLKPGFHECKFAVIGTIDGKQWSRRVDGTLIISPDGAPVASSSSPWADLLRYAACAMTKRDRQEFLAKVAAGTVPEPTCPPSIAAEIAAEIESALSAYRATKPVAKRGTVSFTPLAAT